MHAALIGIIFAIHMHLQHMYLINFCVPCCQLKVSIGIYYLSGTYLILNDGMYESNPQGSLKIFLFCQVVEIMNRFNKLCTYLLLSYSFLSNNLSLDISLNFLPFFLSLVTQVGSFQGSLYILRIETLQAIDDSLKRFAFVVELGSHYSFFKFSDFEALLEKSDAK